MRNKLTKAIKRLTATIDDQRGAVTPAQAMAYAEHVLAEQGYTNIQVQQPTEYSTHYYRMQRPKNGLEEINEVTLVWSVGFTCDPPDEDTYAELTEEQMFPQEYQNSGAIASDMHVWEVPSNAGPCAAYPTIYGEW